MKHFDNIKRHTRESIDALPDNLSWDQMEDSIFDDEGDAKSGLWFTNWKNLAIGILSIGLIISSVLLFNAISSLSKENSVAINNSGASNTIEETKNLGRSDHSISQDKANETNPTSDSKSTMSISGPANSEKSSLSKGELNTQNASITNPIKAQKHRLSNVNNSSTKTRLQSSSDNFEESLEDGPGEAITSSTPNMSPQLDEVSSSINQTNAQNSGTIVGDPLTNDTKGHSTQVDKSDHVEIGVDRILSIGSLVNKIELLPNDLSKINFHIELSPEVKVVEVVEGFNPWSLAIGGGTNIGSSSRMPYESTKIQLGHQYGGELDYRMNNNWSISSGVSMSTWNTKLDYSNVRLESRSLTDTLIGISTNAISGLQTEIIGNTTVVDTFTRVVIHHNSYKLLRIPLMVNYTIDREALSFRFGVGAAAAILISTEGRLQDGFEFPAFSEIEDLHTNETSFEGMLSVGIEKRLNDRFSFGVDIRINKQLTSWTELEKYELNAIHVASNLYFRFRF